MENRQYRQNYPVKLQGKFAKLSLLSSAICCYQRHVLTIPSWKISIAVLFSLASLAFLGRIAIRLSIRRRVFLDDCLLVLSFLCLVAATTVFYLRARLTYLIFSLMRGDQVIALIAAEEIDHVFKQMDYAFTYISTLWSTIFLVKLCYFAFFRVLLKSMSKHFVRYYWTALAFTVVCWIYLVAQTLISCPYFGESSCTPIQINHNCLCGN
jgi:hypothetical protein